MEHLYAPWRSRYLLRQVSRKKSLEKGCVFCAKLREQKDKKNLVLYRGETTFILMNLFPYNDGHLLVAPFRHKAFPSQLSREEWGELNETCRRALAVLEKAFHPEGFNVGMNLGKTAGAGVAEHLHIHVVPRWTGDTNFMPLVGKTKVINQDLKLIYEKLFPLLKKI